VASSAWRDGSTGCSHHPVERRTQATGDTQTTSEKPCKGGDNPPQQPRVPLKLHSCRPSRAGQCVLPLLVQACYLQLQDSSASGRQASMHSCSTPHTYRQWRAGPDVHLLKAQLLHVGQVAQQDLVVNIRAQAGPVGGLNLRPEVLDTTGHNAGSSSSGSSRGLQWVSRTNKQTTALCLQHQHRTMLAAPTQEYACNRPSWLHPSQKQKSNIPRHPSCSCSYAHLSMYDR
jgi:hypothetical protein